MIPSTMRVFVCASPVNMRCSFDSLATLVIEQLDEDPTRSDALFVFVNVARDKVKLLWRDENGVCLLYKRWDDDVASLPEIGDGVTHVTIDSDSLARLLPAHRQRRLRRSSQPRSRSRTPRSVGEKVDGIAVIRRR